MKSSKIPSPIGLLVACVLAACSGSSSQPPRADASPDLGDARGDTPLPDAASVADSSADEAPDLSVRDAASHAETGPVDTLGPLVDAAGQVDAAGSDASQAKDSGIDTRAVDLATADVLASEAGGEAQPAFACSSLGAVPSDVSQRLCFDFSDPS